MKHLQSILDWTSAEVEEVLALAAKIKRDFKAGKRPSLLANKVVTQVFEKPSLRTRVSFEAASAQLGGHCVFLSAQEAGLHGRESLPDVARVLSSFSDAVVLRTFSHALIEEFAANSSCPVINGLSDGHHPCQALTDMFTIREELEGLDGKQLVYIGDGNNVAVSLAEITALLGMPLVVCTPPGYELDKAFVADLKQRFPKLSLTATHDPQAAVKQADVIYTDVWASMGQEAEAAARQKLFAPYQVNAALMKCAPARCRFMHCLPAHRGEEVTDDVLDGPQSIAFPEAENRMHLAKGLLVWLIEKAAA